MLILTRKPGESLYIGDNVKITIVEIKGHQIRVGIDAPPELRIYREEIYLQILEENKQAAAAVTSSTQSLDNLSSAWQGRNTAPAGSGVKGLSGFSARKVSSTGTANQPTILRKKRKSSVEDPSEGEDKK